MGGIPKFPDKEEGERLQKEAERLQRKIPSTEEEKLDEIFKTIPVGIGSKEIRDQKMKELFPEEKDSNLLNRKLITYQIKNAAQIIEWQKALPENVRIADEHANEQVKDKISKEKLPYSADALKRTLYAAEPLPPTVTTRTLERDYKAKIADARMKAKEEKLKEISQEVAKSFIEGLKDMMEKTDWKGSKYSFHTTATKMPGAEGEEKTVYLRSGAKKIYDLLKGANETQDYEATLRQIFEIGAEHKNKKPLLGRDKDSEHLYTIINDGASKMRNG